MSDRLFRRIDEYYDLLGFLFKQYPNILDEWKGKNAVVTSDSNSTDVNTGGTNSNVYRNRIAK